MKTRFQNSLLLICVLTVLFAGVVYLLPSGPGRIILGLPLILFFPGYVLSLAIFPRKTAMDDLERVALSFGLSIMVVPLMGLLLDYTPLGITEPHALLSLLVFTILTSLVAWYRQSRLAKVERFTIHLSPNLFVWRGRSVVDKALAVVLIVAVLGALGTLGYAFAAPRFGEKFTEFYLRPDSEATPYPIELRAGETGRVTVGVINHERDLTTYQIEVRIDNEKNGQTDLIKLETGGKWEGKVSFTPDKARAAQKVEFLLYKNGSGEPYLELHLWVNVRT